MSKAKKQFDAVEMMRSIRDQISAQIQGMTLQEEREWLESQDLKDPFLRRIRDKASQQSKAGAGTARHS
jgi:FtsZ-interacting cell division protein ZipA